MAKQKVWIVFYNEQDSQDTIIDKVFDEHQKAIDYVKANYTLWDEDFDASDEESNLNPEDNISEKTIE